MTPYASSDRLSMTLTGSSPYKKWSEIYAKYNVTAKLEKENDQILSTIQSSGSFEKDKNFDVQLPRELLKNEPNTQKEIHSIFNETLTIACTVILEPQVGIRFNKESAAPYVWNIEKLCDYSIECSDGSEINVHQHLLGLKCPALGRALLSQQIPEVTKIKFANMEPKAVREAVRFIYTGKLEDIGGVEDDIMEIAHKLEINGLAEACVDHLEKTMSIGSAVGNLIMSQDGDFVNLKISSIKFIIANIKEIRQNETWKQLSKFPDLLMELFDYVDNAV